MRTRLLRTVLRQVCRPGADTGPPDADLLRRFAADRDEAAFAELVRRHARLVWAVCRNLLAHEADAEDAFQATFLALVRSADRVREGNALGGWLHGVAVRVCRKAKRSAARRRREAAVAVGERRGLPPPAGDWEALLAAVHEEVCRLPDAQRVPFVLCCLEGKGVTEAAAQLGWKLGTLSGRLTRAKQAVLARLAKRGIGPGAAAVAAVVSGEPASAAGCPPRLVERVLGLAAPDGVVSESVLHLAQGVTTMGMTTTKLLAAGVLLAAAVGATVWSGRAVPTADAQNPGPGYRDTVREYYQRAQGATAGTAAAAHQWEYKYVPFGDADYERKANELGRDGWEMVCNVGGSNFFFKRPKPAPRSVTTTTAESPRNATEGLNRLSRKVADGDAATEVIPLRNAAAPQMTATLAALFTNRLAVSADERTNSLIVKGPADVVKEVKELIEKLDALPGKGDTRRKTP